MTTSRAKQTTVARASSVCNWWQKQFNHNSAFQTLLIHDDDDDKRRRAEEQKSDNDRRRLLLYVAMTNRNNWGPINFKTFKCNVFTYDTLYYFSKQPSQKMCVHKHPAEWSSNGCFEIIKRSNYYEWIKEWMQSRAEVQNTNNRVYLCGGGNCVSTWWATVVDDWTGVLHFVAEKKPIVKMQPKLKRRIRHLRRSFSWASKSVLDRAKVWNKKRRK